MKTWLEILLGFITIKNSYEHRRKAEEEWLAKSSDLVELERRQRRLANGDVRVL